MTEPDRTFARRQTWRLFGAVALASTGYIAAITVSTLAARALSGSTGLAGIPTALATLGTAFGTSVMGGLAVRRGRRQALMVAFGIGGLGALVSVGSTVIGSYLVLCAGMFTLGMGNSAVYLSRYAAADLAAPERRGSAVSLIVWAGTVGAVVGPRLLAPAADIAVRLTPSEYAGGYLVATALMVSAALVHLAARHPLPVPGQTEDTDVTWRPSQALAIPGVQVAIATLVTGQAVMVLIMSATPLHIEDVGFGLELVGVVISAHTLGMFAFSPVTGWLTDRLGSRPMIVLGAAGLVASAWIAGTAPEQSTLMLGWGLFLLGLAWNWCFVAASALLTASAPAGVRTVLQGRVDSAVWTASALAGAGSGAALRTLGYGGLALVGGVMAVVPLVALAARWRPAAQPA